VFFGSHVAMGLEPVRARLGPRLHVFAYGLVAWVTFTALCAVYASLRFTGAPGPSLATHPVRPVLFACSVVGVVFMVVGAIGYPRAPMRVLQTRTSEPAGVQRITRHAIFVGLVLWGGAHALLSTHLTGTVFFGGLGLQAGLGAWLQDRKLLARRGEPYRALCAATSTVPFVAVLQGRQRLVLRELPLLGLGVAFGLLAAWALRLLHPDLFAWHGLGLALFVIVGSSLISIGALWPDERRPDS